MLPVKVSDSHYNNWDQKTLPFDMHVNIIDRGQVGCQHSRSLLRMWEAGQDKQASQLSGFQCC